MSEIRTLFVRNKKGVKAILFIIDDLHESPLGFHAMSCDVFLFIK